MKYWIYARLHKWFGHRRIRIPDSDFVQNMDYCKWCGCLLKTDNAKPCFYNTGYRAIVPGSKPGSEDK
jgi:hypothetical protein